MKQSTITLLKRAALGLALVCVFSQASASTILFQGSNPAFFPNANPGAIAQLMDSVRKPTDPATAAAANANNPSSIVQQAVESEISSKINDIIFNTNNASGTFNLGGGNEITFSRAGGQLTINVTEPSGTTQFTLSGV
jgi:hypothetical protein